MVTSPVTQPQLKSRAHACAAQVRIGLVQMLCHKGDIEENLRQIEARLQYAIEHGLDVLLFPEMSITGYINPTRMPEAVITLDSAPVRRLAAMTAGHDVTVVAGIVENNPAGKPFITQIAVQRGAIVGVYRKITLGKDGEAEWFSPGAGVCVFPIGAVRAGMAICADTGNPEVFAACRRERATLVLVAAAPGLYGEQATRDWQAGFDWWRESCARDCGRWARENGLWIAVATQAGRTVDEDFPGGGYLFDPEGSCVAATPDWSEGLIEVEVFTRAQ